MNSNVSSDRAMFHCPRCGLNQFRNAIGLCRRCHHALNKRHIYESMLKPRFSDNSAAPIAKRVGATIRKLRMERRFSQERLAMTMGTARSYISKIERGLAAPSLSTLDRLASALETDLAEIFLRVRM